MYKGHFHIPFSVIIFDRIPYICRGDCGSKRISNSTSPRNLLLQKARKSTHVASYFTEFIIYQTLIGARKTQVQELYPFHCCD